MAPIIKRRVNKSSEANEKESAKNANESVVSGQLQKKINKKQRQQQGKRDPRGIVLVKHLPHGFFEEQLRNYFEQFGNVTRLRLVRSDRTGNSKGYAFVEFEYPEVAEVAAATMNNYLMFKKIVKAVYIPPEEQRFNYFRSSVRKINKWGKPVWVSYKTGLIRRNLVRYNDWSEENFQKRTKKQLKKIEVMGKKYAHLGIDINKILMQPKILLEKKEKKIEKPIAKKAKEIKTVISSKANKKEMRSSSKERSSKKLKKKLPLEGVVSTVQEDSDDNLSVAGCEEDNLNETSSGKVCSFSKDVDDDNESKKLKSKNGSKMGPTKKVKKTNQFLCKSSKFSNIEGSENDNTLMTGSAEDNVKEIEEVYDSSKDLGDDDNENKKVESKHVSRKEVSKKVNRTNSFLSKSLKSSNIGRFGQIIKRKPHISNIKKLNQKPLKQSDVINKNKRILQLDAAKELAKPLSEVKGKLGKSVKCNKNTKRV